MPKLCIEVDVPGREGSYTVDVAKAEREFADHLSGYIETIGATVTGDSTIRTEIEKLRGELAEANETVKEITSRNEFDAPIWKKLEHLAERLVGMDESAPCCNAADQHTQIRKALADAIEAVKGATEGPWEALVFIANADEWFARFVNGDDTGLVSEGDAKAIAASVNAVRAVAKVLGESDV